MILFALLTLTVTGCEGPRTTPEEAGAAAEPELNAAQAAYADVNMRMHSDMATIDPDADVAFMQGMLAHHIGAVEMAEVMLEHGEDAEARALAKDIIAAQQPEIDQMTAWLAARDAALPTDAVDGLKMDHSAH